MFIYSVRASTIRFFSVIVLTLVILATLLIVGSGDGAFVSASSDVVDFSPMKTNEDRVEFISQFGINAKEAPVETEEFRVPENFDKVIAGYNEIQKKQGLDLSKYKNKKVTRYTYEASGYGESSDTVFVNLIVYRNTVIACDVSATNPDGFVAPLVKLN